MPPTDPPIDVTDILAQPREFAQKLARVERERAELIETVARLRAECNDAQAVARAYILRAERAEAEAVRLTAALETYAEARDMVLKALPAVAINESEELWGASNTALVRKALSFLWHCAALRGQPAPAQGQE